MTLTIPSATPARPHGANGEPIPPLCNGDRLDAVEFMRRYHAMPDVNKAELVEGVVYMPSPVSHEGHGLQHGRILAWLGTYLLKTPGVDLSINATIRLDLDNVPQPDALLMIRPDRGGRTQGDGGYIVAGPELACEVSATSASIDRNAKMRAYQRNGICEYLMWRTFDVAIDWFALREGGYEPLVAGPDGVLRSEVFPGLWLDVQAMLTDDLARMEAVLLQGIASPEHAAFVAQLQAHA